MSNEPGSPYYRVPIAVDLLNFNKDALKTPAEFGEVKVQYYVKGIGNYEAYKNKKNWLNQHSMADVWVSTEDGTPLYALYKSPFASQEEMSFAFFKSLRAERYSDDEL